MVYPYTVIAASEPQSRNVCTTKGIAGRARNDELFIIYNGLCNRFLRIYDFYAEMASTGHEPMQTPQSMHASLISY